MGTLVYVVVTRGDSWSTGREFESASLSISVLFLPLLPIFVLAFISCHALMSLKGNNQQPTQSLYYGNTVLDYIMLYLYSEVPLYLYLKYTSKKVFSHKKIHLLLWCNPLWIENLFRGTGDRTRRTLMKMYYEAVSLFALVFLKNGPIPASFCLFSSFSRYNFNTNWKSIDGVLGIRTRGRRMVGADETTELLRPPLFALACSRLCFLTVVKRWGATVVKIFFFWFGMNCGYIS